MPERPNLLIVWTDEQRADSLGCYGNPAIRTPNLDRLAAGSYVFDHPYCVQPVCTPSRGTVMTGLYPRAHGAMKNNQAMSFAAKTIAEYLPPEYLCAYMGKWHLGDEIFRQHGFSEWVSIEDNYRAWYSQPEYLGEMSSYYRYLVANGFPPDARAPDGAPIFSRSRSAVMAYPFTKAGFLAQQASRFLADREAGRPFCLSVNFLEPHMPFFGPFNNLYDPAELPVGEAFAVPPDDEVSLRNQVWHRRFARANPLGQGEMDEAAWRRLRANYYGLVTMVDQAVGSILDALAAAGLADNTIVVYTSDHGDLMGDHAMYAKGVLYEEAVKVPWLMRVPWLNRQEVHVPGRISHIDLVPTLLDLMGCPATLPGISRVPVLEGRETLAGNDVVVLWEDDSSYHWTGAELPGFDQQQLDRVSNQNWLSLIGADGWKLNLCATDQAELFDLNTDPCELRNRYREPEQRPRIAEMTARLRAWQEENGYADLQVEA